MVNDNKDRRIIIENDTIWSVSGEWWYIVFHGHNGQGFWNNMIIEKKLNSYAGHFKYIHKNIHLALEQHEAIEMMMIILVKEMSQYSYKLKFNIVNGIFINELIISEDGIEGQGDSRDTFGDKVEKDFNRRNCGLSIWVYKAHCYARYEKYQTDVSWNVWNKTRKDEIFCKK